MSNTKRCVSVDIPSSTSGLEKLGEAGTLKPHCSFGYLINGINDQFSLEELGGNVCKVFHPNGNFCLLHDFLDLFFTNSIHVVVVVV